MKRRDFLKSGIVASAAFALDFSGLQTALAAKNVIVAKGPDLVAVMGGEPADMLARALKELCGIGKYV